MSEVVIVEATLDIHDQYSWSFSVRTAGSLYDSSGELLRSSHRTRHRDSGPWENITILAAARARGVGAANHAAQIAQRVCGALEQMGEDAALYHYIGATRTRLQRRDYYGIDLIACARELDALLMAARVRIGAARTAELKYLRAADDALAECLVRRGISQSCVRGWLYEDGVLYSSGLHYASGVEFPLPRIVFKDCCC